MTARTATGAVAGGVAFTTLGCKVNRAESDGIAAELVKAGAILVDPDEAELIVVNSCTVTAEADAKVRKAVRRALHAASAPVVLVTGCLATLDPAGLRDLGDRVIVEADKERAADRARELLGLAGREGAGRDRASVPGARTRVVVKVQDGCNASCSYCIIPRARGLPRSRPAGEVVSEVARLAEAGVKEVVVAGINLGLYRDRGIRLPGLLDRIADTGVARVRLSSIEPDHVCDELLDVLRARAHVICAHLHVPLQSGSDAVLEAMARTYTRAGYCETIDRVRRAIPGVSLTTDVIVGFPGEREEDHRATLELVERIGFSRVHIFRFSPRPGTPAASFGGRVDPSTLAVRAAEMRSCAERAHDRFVASRERSVVEVLVERVSAGVATGTSREYLTVSFPAAGVEVGELREVVLGAGAVVSAR